MNQTERYNSILKIGYKQPLPQNGEVFRLVKNVFHDGFSVHQTTFVNSEITYDSVLRKSKTKNPCQKFFDNL